MTTTETIAPVVVLGITCQHNGDSYGQRSWHNGYAAPLHVSPGQATAEVLTVAGGTTVLEVLREQHGPLCFCAEVCMPSPREPAGTQPGKAS